MKNKNKLIIILISLFILNSCGSGLKDALEGKRRSKSGDEFLIEKKNPLSLPPYFGDLPKPTEEEELETENNSDEIENILSKNQSNSDSGEVSEVESLILEEINNN